MRLPLFIERLLPEHSTIHEELDGRWDPSAKSHRTEVEIRDTWSFPNGLTIIRRQFEDTATWHFLGHHRELVVSTANPGAGYDGVLRFTWRKRRV